MGNRTWILRRFGRVRDVDLEHEKVQSFHGEITFFVRTLYFLFLGGVFAWGTLRVLEARHWRGRR